MNPTCTASAIPTRGTRGKVHKPYEYGNKVSIAATAKSNIIVGLVSQSQNLHDSKTLPEVLAHRHNSRGKAVKTVVCDRGYRGPKTVDGTQIILPAGCSAKTRQPLSTEQKRKRCQLRAAIEPIIDHLKSDFRLARNFLKAVIGDGINLLMAATAWNFSLWMRLFFKLMLPIKTIKLSLLRLFWVRNTLLFDASST